MAFICSDINGNDIVQFLFNDDGTVTGIANSTIATDPLDPTLEEAPASQTTYPQKKTARALKEGEVETFLSAECCRALGFTFDESTNQCFWTETCETNPDFKVVLGSQGNAGAIFQVDENESCILDVSFEYLFQFDCETLLDCKLTNSEISDAEQEVIDQIEDVQSDIEILEQQLADTQQTLEDTITLCDTQIDSINDQINQYEQANDTIQTEKSSTEKLPDSDEKSKKLSGIVNEANQNEIINNALTDALETTSANCETQIANLEAQIDEYETQIAELNEQLTTLNENLTELEQSSLDDPNTIIGMLQALDVCVTIEVEQYQQDSGATSNQSSFETLKTYETIYEEQLFGFQNINPDTDAVTIVDYLNGNDQTGLLFSGSNCDEVINSVIEELGDQCFVVSSSTFNSNWLQHSFTIADSETLSAITNQPIRLAFKVKNCECDFSILVDRIELNKQCTKLEREDIFVSKCPGFELEKVCDNKKSWVALDEKENREYDLSMRETEYDINHHKLAINSKEVDLNISPANAIETDVLAYIKDNPRILSPVGYSGSSTLSGCTFSGTNEPCINSGDTCECSCGDTGFDIDELLTTELSSITTTKEFTRVISSELINATNRKTLSAYPTLRLLYERYMNSEDFCFIRSSQFDYLSMEQFAGLIGDFWIDLVEQVIPSTTIWGATYIYKNTVFDTQKFKYRQYSTLKCSPSNIEYPSPVTGANTTVEVISQDVSLLEEAGPECLRPSGATEICQGVYHAQMDFGSEFIGKVKVIGGDGQNEDDGDVIIIEECDLLITDINMRISESEGTGTALPIYNGGTPPYTYSWTISQQSGGFSDWTIVSGTSTEEMVSVTGSPIAELTDSRLCLSVTITDANGCEYGLSKCYEISGPETNGLTSG